VSVRHRLAAGADRLASLIWSACDLDRDRPVTYRDALPFYLVARLDAAAARLFRP